MTRRRFTWGGIFVALVLVAGRVVMHAHEGPPFPIVSNESAGPYVISVWTDPDTTDDGSPRGQFWVMPKVAADGGDVPDGTRAVVTIRPLDRTGQPHRGLAEPVGDDIGRQFVALLMDHEGRFGVHVAIDGPLGPATVESEVEGTYDGRPAPAMFLLYLAPFVAVGWLWMKALRRQRPRSPGPGRR